MKSITWVAGALILLIGGFFAFNVYIYNEKQDDGAAHFQDGVYLGFVHAFTDNNTAMDFDDATWLSGKAGEDAAIRAGLCNEATRGECLPNDYFIENLEKKDARLTINPQVRVFMQTRMMEETGSVGAHEITLEEFAGLINDSSAHWRALPYEIMIANGGVTRIEEIYVP